MAKRLERGSLRSMIEECGLTEVDVAKDMGVHKSTVCRWCSGECEFTFRQALKLATILGCTVEEIRVAEQ